LVVFLEDSALATKVLNMLFRSVASGLLKFRDKILDSFSWALRIEEPIRVDGDLGDSVLRLGGAMRDRRLFGRR
jgi:hypothetical protein